MEISTKILSEVTNYMKYARFLPKVNRRETWEEEVTRNKLMHLKRFPKFHKEISEAYQFVYDRKVLPSMRSMQFAGKAIELNHARIYNCSYQPIDHPVAFAETMFLLLSGCGVGYSVQRHHIDKLPEITKPRKSYRYVVQDSIIGWSDAVKVLMYSYLRGKSLPRFDFSDIRPKGAELITSGGKAPGPEPLRVCLFYIQTILDRKNDGDKLTTLEVHDILCHIADAVLAGGIRRAAMIALFDLDDDDILSCKFGNWWEENPQRGRANNSAVILRHKIDKQTFIDLWRKIEASNSGEPGFLLSNDRDMGTNPCGEVALRPHSFCNLTTFNISDVKTQEELNELAKVAARIGTIQASYTDFHYLRAVWRHNTEKDALIGVSMTGVASGNITELDFVEATNVVNSENARVAEILGINKAARTTVLKPEGTSSLVLGTSSGIHSWYAKYYLRTIRVGKNEPIYRYLVDNHPELVEDEYFKPHIQAIIRVPQKAPDNAITREESALDLLERIKLVYTKWIKPGHRRGSNTNNVSATVTIKPHEWEEVGEWMWNNRDSYTALSVLPFDNGSYIQAPFEEITKEQYEEAMKHLSLVDLSKVIEIEDMTTLQSELACSGNACEIK
jgi:ribonucleoside-triphosphate reductase